MNKNIIITIVALTLAGVGFYVWGGAPKKEAVDIITSTTATDDAVTSTSNWQVYQNKKHGFEIKYPNNFEAEDFSHSSNSLSNSCENILLYNKEVPQTKEAYEIEKDNIRSIEIYINPTEECVREKIIEKYTTTASQESATYLGEEEYTINETKFMKKKYLAFTPGIKPKSLNQITYASWELSLNGKLYLFSYINHANKQSEDGSFTDTEFKEILSTFNAY